MFCRGAAGDDPPAAACNPRGSSWTSRRIENGSERMMTTTTTTKTTKTSDSTTRRKPEIDAPTERRPDWTNILFMASSHLLAIAGVLWLVLARTSPWTIGLGVLWYVLCGVAITGGYHRLFAHPTYRASWILRALYLVFGAAAVQNSALRWSADHRRHHARTDQEEDPYNIQRGVWWAHMGWVFFKDVTPRELHGVKDLQNDALVRWQDRYYVWIALAAGAAVPTLLGFLWGDPIGGLLVGCFLRMTVQWHATGSVNSIAHWLGSRPYSRTTSARDSFWTALITLGEGYHNFHHRFQGDYRNGVRAYHFDPTKWFVWTLAHLGLTWDLRRTPRETIHRVRAAVLAETRATGRQGKRSRRS
jgi:stearoyl-CoA desaturase (Delta-9 desaturase)